MELLMALLQFGFQSSRADASLFIYHMTSDNSLILVYFEAVTPRFPVRPDWRIRTEFGARDRITGTLYLIFFLYIYNRIKISYTYQKNYHRSGVHQNLYTYTESHLQIQNCTFTFTNQSAESTCSEPLLVCWPSSMWKFSDVFSYTYTD